MTATGIVAVAGARRLDHAGHDTGERRRKADLLFSSRSTLP
jgi:hypothetical protein